MKLLNVLKYTSVLYIMVEIRCGCCGSGVENVVRGAISVDEQENKGESGKTFADITGKADVKEDTFVVSEEKKVEILQECNDLKTHYDINFSDIGLHEGKNDEVKEESDKKMNSLESLRSEVRENNRKLKDILSYFFDKIVETNKFDKRIDSAQNQDTLQLVNKELKEIMSSFHGDSKKLGGSNEKPFEVISYDMLLDAMKNNHLRAMNILRNIFSNLTLYTLGTTNKCVIVKNWDKLENPFKAEDHNYKILYKYNSVLIAFYMAYVKDKEFEEVVNNIFSFFSTESQFFKSFLCGFINNEKPYVRGKLNGKEKDCREMVLAVGTKNNSESNTLVRDNELTFCDKVKLDNYLFKCTDIINKKYQEFIDMK